MQVIMDDVVIDACCLINVYAAGTLRTRLLTLGRRWYVPSIVVREALYVHQVQADGTTVKIAIDLQSLIDDGTVHSCDATENAELDLFVDFAAQIDDGEAMALAIAKSRGWTVATDDRKAIRLAGEHSIPILTTPDLMKSWADATNAAPHDLRRALENIEQLASFYPASRHHLHKWWNDILGR
jgi:predicted nucleic acid-binding protein